MMNLDEPRTNVAYMFLKYAEHGIITKEAAAKLLAKLYEDLFKAAEVKLIKRDAPAIDKPR